MALAYVGPTVREGRNVAKLDRMDVEKMSKAWEWYVAMFVVGSTPTIDLLHKFISLDWEDIAKPTIVLHEQGFFVVRFRSEDDYNVVIKYKPLAMGQSPCFG